MKLGNLLAPLYSLGLLSNGPEPVTIEEAMKTSGQDFLVKMVSNNGHGVSLEWNEKISITIHTQPGKKLWYSFSIPELYDRPIDFEGKTMEQLLCDSEYVIKSGDSIDEYCEKQREPLPSYLETLWEDSYSRLASLLRRIFSPESNYITIDEAMKVSGQDVLAKIESNNPNTVIIEWNQDSGFRNTHTPKDIKYRFALPGLGDRKLDFEGKTIEQLLCDSQYVIKSGAGIDEWCRKQREPMPSYLETLKEDCYTYLASLMERIWPKSPELPTPNYVTVDELMKGTSEEFMGSLEVNGNILGHFEPNKAVLQMLPQTCKDNIKSVVEGTKGYYIDTEGKTLSQICCESEYVSRSGDGVDEWCSKYNSGEDSTQDSVYRYFFYTVG